MKRALVLLALALVPWNARTEGELPTREEAKRIVSVLASRAMWGRGYTRGGMGRAADWIEREVSRAGLKPLFEGGYRQAFEHPVNTFPDEVSVEIDGKPLRPGLDFIVAPDCPSIDAEGALVASGDGVWVDPSRALKIESKEKLTWSVSRKVGEEARIRVLPAALPKNPARYRARVRNAFVERFAAENVGAVVPGTEDPESVLVMSAHYDHLGGMGREAWFPGANDNASGVALLLSLARWYAENPAPKTLVFLFFAGEEAGLLGSKHFVDHPPFPLSRIRFVSNFDLAGTGEDGITVVNGTEFTEAFELLRATNAKLGAFKTVNARGKAPNSDHYWFSERGVPAFFLYTLGGIAAYHDVHDRARTLPMTKFEEYFRLVLAFQEGLARPSIRRR